MAEDKGKSPEVSPSRRPKYHKPVVILVGLMTLGSGIVTVVSVAGRDLPGRYALLREVFPMDFVHLARFLSLLIGFALVVSSLNIFKRKRRAFLLVMALSALSVMFHLTKGLDYEEAALSLAVMGALLLTRKSFTVKSSIPEMRWALYGLVTAAAVAVFYGTIGFWLLDKRDFGINFTFPDALRRTFTALAFINEPDLVPRTRFAGWFLNSLDVISAMAIAYALFALYRPMLYRFRTLPHERSQAEGILEKFGRSSLDLFKLSSDKVYYFTPSGRAFLAYRMAGSFAVVLADPVGPDEEIGGIIRAFKALCEENDWKLAFHQVLPDLLTAYRDAGFKKLKIGEEAIIDFGAFSLDGKRMKHVRHCVNQFEKDGTRFVYYDPPIPDDVMAGLREVSDDWLEIPGRRERCFTMGAYSDADVRATPVFAAVRPDGRIEAFMNVVRSYVPGETTIDLMRHRRDAPDGIMDGLFVHLFERQKARGFTRFSLGMAPMSGFRDGEEAGAEERAVQYFLHRLNFLFSYAGLYHYKAKFATHWEPRYTIYRNVVDLPRLAVALTRVSEIRPGEAAND